MRNSVLSLCFFLFTTSSFTQEIISSTYAGGASEFLLEILFQQDFKNGVDYYSVTYTTHDTEGLLDTASGLFVIPDNIEEEHPYLIYQHGTVGSKDEVPSMLDGGYELAVAFGGYGYITVAPDFLGLGTSRGFHPYVHSESEASAAIDMLIACKELGQDMEIATNDELFVIGYSQGGHAAMAALYYLEKDYSDELPVRAAAPLSGPYDVSGKMVEYTLGDREYGTVAYLPYLAVGYQRVYNDIFIDTGIDGFFKQPYADQIERFANHEITLWELNGILIDLLETNEGMSVPKFMLQDSILSAILNDPTHRVSQALADNDLFDWAPQTPMRMFYCTGDEQVFYENSTKADSVMNANGAPNVAAENVGEGLTHGECVIPAALAADAFFTEIMNTSSIIELPSSEFRIFPNPTSDHISISLENEDRIKEISIYDFTGRLVSQLLPNNSNFERIDVDRWVAGLYTILLKTDKAQIAEKVMVR